jgi:hypothetical protein
MPEDTGEGVEYALVMPFVTVRSKGGPHDDQSYVAGYEVGLISAEMAHASKRVTRYVHMENVPQLDLVAMQHRYRATFSEESAEAPGWVLMDASPA